MATTNGAASDAKHGENVAPTTQHKKKPTVCVFCGASDGDFPEHLEAARSLAQALHYNGLSLVYGGGTTGMMGEVARTLVSLSGPGAVHGIIPTALLGLERQTAIDAQKYGRTTEVADMHTRKQMMAREVIEGGVGGGFIALTGGYGTLEELMEMTTWNQLGRKGISLQSLGLPLLLTVETGIHDFPIVVYNVIEFWYHILKWVEVGVKHGMIKPDNATIMVEAKSAEEAIEKLTTYKKSEGRFKLQWSDK